MGFLYFPEDKSLYIPSFIVLALFIIGAIWAMYMIKRVSKKEEQRFEEKYKDVNKELNKD